MQEELVQKQEKEKYLLKQERKFQPIRAIVGCKNVKKR